VWSPSGSASSLSHRRLTALSRTNDKTTFFPLRLFGKLAEGSESIKKGAKVLVDGKLGVSEYTDKEGQKRTSFRILADAYRLL
jgi:single-stranded DNA-binding protein